MFLQNQNQNDPGSPGKTSEAQNHSCSMCKHKIADLIIRVKDGGGIVKVVQVIQEIVNCNGKFQVLTFSVPLRNKSTSDVRSTNCKWPTETDDFSRMMPTWRKNVSSPKNRKLTVFFMQFCDLKQKNMT